MKYGYVHFLDQYNHYLQSRDDNKCVNVQYIAKAGTLEFHFPEYGEVEKIVAISIAFDGDCTTATINRICKVAWGPTSIIEMYKGIVDSGTMLTYYADHLYMQPHAKNFIEIIVNSACKVYVEAVGRFNPSKV